MIIPGKYLKKISSSLADAFSGPKETSTANTLKKFVSNTKQAYASSALDLERQSVLNAFTDSNKAVAEAFKNMQTSANKQMEFQANQAKLAYEREQTSANKQMEFQREMLQKQMDYETLMSNTAVQRQMKDLRSAGINPILAGSYGGSSSPSVGLPSGAMASAKAMSGAMANAQSAQAFKGDYTSAKNSDISAFSDILKIIGSVFTSAFKLIK